MEMGNANLTDNSRLDSEREISMTNDEFYGTLKWPVGWF